jgi:DNA polymerase-1
MLAKEKLYVKGRVHCTMALARLVRNDELKYSLDACARRIGYEKDDTVEEYISENKLYEKVSIPGKKQKETIKYYNQVPLNIMVKYGEKDAMLTYKLGIYQEQKFKEMNLMEVYENELKLTKTCFDMELRGVQLDMDYVRDANLHEFWLLDEAKQNFKTLSGITYKAGPKCLAAAFEALNLEYPLTEKGNPCFNKEALSKMDNPLADIIRRIRTHEKNIGTYYSSFSYYADDSGCLHANIRQGGTETGRFSYSDPNLQNIPKEDGGRYPVRRSFKPREGFRFVMIDYDQQEYRMMLDYAGETTLIDKVLAGVDVHQATADIVRISRTEAKTLNFALLYGAGKYKISEMLGIPEAEATHLIDRYFLELPYVRHFLRSVKTVGGDRGWIQNWLGRRCYILKPEYNYILPNHLIQGGCADVIKVAMNKCADYLKGKLSSMLIQVHDELLFEVHESELDIIPDLRSIMESVYKPRNGLNLTCSVDYSTRSWHDKEPYES